ncbi:MAG: hypothetical protein K1X33_02730 [Methanobacteriaceae archaeon]|nr:hypothetical protein [Methanobacteriaceae archaeon]
MVDEKDKEDKKESMRKWSEFDTTEKLLIAFALLCLAIVLIGAIASIVFPDVNTSGLLTSLF